MRGFPARLPRQTGRLLSLVTVGLKSCALALYRARVRARLTLPSLPVGDSFTDACYSVTRPSETAVLMGERAPPKQDEVKDEKGGALWPLPYRMQIPQGSGQPRWWSHELYRGPKNTPIQILYSKDKAQSEILAKKFLDEPIVGFDMEWPWNSEKRHRLQEKIGLIQVASEDKIALFHIGMHPGKTSEDIIAPSLKKLIESPTIAKTGVSILHADFSRLKKFFGLKPQGALELSHMHRLVKFGAKPELLTTKLVKLAYQVEEHLGLPLSKGEVRTSNWSKPLSKEQIRYAASDAYAGFMLFHRMNAKRAALTPTPPLPILAESYSAMGSGMTNMTDIRLHPLAGGTEIITAKDFFKPKEEENVVDENTTASVEISETAPVTITEVKKKKERVKKVKVVEDPLDAMSKLLYDGLAVRRKALAGEQGLPAYRIATNAVLEGLARRRPEQDEELLEVKGIGNMQRDKYGAEWLEVIAHFLATNEQHIQVVSVETTVAADQPAPPATPSRKARRRRLEPPDSPDSSPMFGSPTQRTPQLHTGLSFTLAGTQLDDEDTVAGAPPSPTPRRPPPVQLGDVFYPTLNTTFSSQNSDSDRDGSSVYATPPSHPQSHLKRKREATLPDKRPASPDPTPAPLTPRSRIFRSKLVAFSKLVTRKLTSRPPDAGPIVSEATLDHIVTVSPHTLEALHSIPDVGTFAQACTETDMDLLRNIIKFAPARF